jgi:TolB protein
MKIPTALLAAAITLLAGCGDAHRSTLPLAPRGAHTAESDFDVISTIAHSSTRHDPTNPNQGRAAEVYLMDADGTNPRRLTNNTSIIDYFATLSPDGKKIAFDSNRLRTPEEPENTSDIFVMDTDGAGQTRVVRGSSPTWSADSRNIAFHASASGTGLPIKADFGAATFDSDIFTINVDDAIAGAAVRRNITNSPEAIDDDADWSPDGQLIAFTSHSVDDNHQNSVTAEIYVIDPNGAGAPVPLTHNSEEERAPSWSPDGSRICFMCRRGGNDFEICVMNADGTGQQQLTSNTMQDATPTFSPDGQRIVFQRIVQGPPPQLQLFVMNADGSGQMQLTFAPGNNAAPNWGVRRVHATNLAQRVTR